MACCGPDAIRIKRPTGQIVKTGYLKLFERGFFSDGWKTRYFVLFDDSSLIWYDNHSSYHHSGGVKLKMVANFMAVGPMCLHVPGHPKLPKGKTVTHLMGVPNIFRKGTKKEDISINWILFDNDDEMKQWLDAIMPTLPPPPPRPEPKHGHRNGHAQNGYPQNGHPQNGYTQNGQPPPYGFNQNVVHPANGNPAYPPRQNGYPPAPAPANGHGQQRGQQQNGHTTVIVQNGDGGGGRRGDGDFATGLLLGGAIGYGLGGYGPGYGWGWGWGWGPHPYGGYWGSWGSFSHGGSMNIENNYYDCDHDNDYGYDDNDVGDFEAGDDGHGGDFGDGGDGCGGGCGG